MGKAYAVGACAQSLGRYDSLHSIRFVLLFTLLTAVQVMTNSKGLGYAHKAK